MKQTDASPYILHFSAISAANLLTVGGKGANLGEMTRAGFPVPPGFCLTTSAFSCFMTQCDEADALYEAMANLAIDDLEAARAVGQRVRQTLAEVPIPADVADAVLNAWRQQGAEHAYAVRSSATAEDLPDASFAGQQDTILNVRGQDALLDAVRRCWISLFTDRAILYRAQNGFPHREVALAVVVQQMVLPDVSGILFTADPVSGNRHVASIDASYGLGEALVAGLVSADLYKVDKRTLTDVEVTVAEKKLAIRPLPDGGTVQEEIDGPQRTARVLSDAQAILLAELGKRVEAHYGQPQDIEWAIAGDKIYLLQTRPITSLFPIPEKAAQMNSLQVMFSFAAVQGMMDPMTPLGRDAIAGIFAGGASLFGLQRTPSNQAVILSAGGRIWGNVTPVLRHPLGRRLLRAAMPMIEPGAAAAIETLLPEPALQPSRRWLRWSTIWRVGRFFLPTFGRLLHAMRHPDHQRQRVQQYLEMQLAGFERRQAKANTVAERLDFFEAVVFSAFPIVVSQVVPIIAGGMASLNALIRLRRSLPADGPNVLELTRGLPHNVTTEMDLALWQTAQAIQAEPAARTHFEQHEAATLAANFLADQLPVTAQTAVAQFLQQYGMRGLAEIDFGRQRWREDPTQVMQVLKSYMQIDNPDLAPDAIFRRGQETAAATLTRLQTALRRTRFGRLKARLAAFLAQRLRALAGLRESPKFFIIKLLGLARAGLLQSGEELAQAGVLDQAEDLFYLHLAELRALAQGEQRGWRALVQARRQAFAREQKRRLIPRLLLSDGRAFYDGITSPAADKEGAIVGSPVSPGLVEGTVRVVFNPHETQLAPGEILVCPGTDPAWTPLFLAAGGLVMEVGGLMTHGSVVAREYGIPAVVGVHEATSRLQTGQRVRVDGTAGTVEVLS